MNLQTSNQKKKNAHEGVIDQVGVGLVAKF